MWNFPVIVFLMHLTHEICPSKIMLNISLSFGLSTKVLSSRQLCKADQESSMKQNSVKHNPSVWKKDSSLVPASARQSVGGVRESTETRRHVKRTYSDSWRNMERWKTNVALSKDSFEKHPWEILQCENHHQQLKRIHQKYIHRLCLKASPVLGS